MDEKIKELKNMMIQNKMDNATIAFIFGVTVNAVNYWLKGDREIPEPVAKCVRLFTKRPELINEFV